MAGSDDEKSLRVLRLEELIRRRARDAAALELNVAKAELARAERGLDAARESRERAENETIRHTPIGTRLTERAIVGFRMGAAGLVVAAEEAELAMRSARAEHRAGQAQFRAASSALAAAERGLRSIEMAMERVDARRVLAALKDEEAAADDRPHVTVSAGVVKS